MNDLKNFELLEEYLKTQNAHEQYMVKESIIYSSKMSAYINKLYQSENEDSEQLIKILFKSCVYGFIFNFKTIEEIIIDKKVINLIKEMLRDTFNEILGDKNA